ncbi:MAG: ELM1/GtrOC1 family putative glycosyltransferase [Pseudomonadota bacterium]
MSKHRIEVSARRPLAIWRYCDGLRGHENQTAGLTEALARRIPIACTDVRVQGRFGATSGEPETGGPDLVIGAGHRTHRALLKAKARTSARAVLLMRPSGATSRFDLCVIPQHDRPDEQLEAHRPAVLCTRGVLNRVTPSSSERSGATVVAIGGPSRHHDWLGAELLAQLTEIAARASDAAPLTVTNSRRTPVETWSAIESAQLPHTQLVEWARQPAGWLVEQMATASTVWVTEDSVSMVYEALSSGAGVGLLAIPRRRVSRVLHGVTALIADGSVTLFQMWQQGASITAPRTPLAEADRVARWIVERWLNVR